MQSGSLQGSSVMRPDLWSKRAGVSQERAGQEWEEHRESVGICPTVNEEVEQLQLLCMLPRPCGRHDPCNLAACKACALQKVLIWQVASRA